MRGDPLISVALYLKGDGLQPSEITGLLGIQPDQAFAKGDFWRSPASGLHQRVTGLWSLRYDDPPSVAQGVAFLVAKVGALEPGVLPMVEEAYLDVFVASDSSAEIDFELDAECVAALSRLRIPIRVTASFSPSRSAAM